MQKIYTKKGDTGTTSLVSGTRVSKADFRLECYGSVDELNSVIGLITSQLPHHGFDHDCDVLISIQNQLFNLGSQLACEDQKLSTQLPSILPEHITLLEKEMDSMSQSLPPLKEFILPGGHPLAAHAHLARTVCRRVERLCQRFAENEALPEQCLPYLNRLSDYFFVLARHFNHILGRTEITWKK